MASELPFNRLLTPEILSSVSGLELISKVIVDGYLSGQNRSARLGAGMEFSQYRSYQPGDDLRSLDWKVLARSDRYYIKEAEIETNISVRFIIDLSNSMLHKEDNVTKLDYARVLVAAMAFLAKHQGDAISLFGLNDSEMVALDSRMDKQHFLRFLDQLTQMNGHGKWPSNKVSTEKLHDRKHKELIIFLSDMHEQNNELIDFINRLKTIRNEVILLQIMGENELEFDYKGAVVFEDLETNDKIKVDALKAKEVYIKAIEGHITNVKRQLMRKRIHYELIRLNEPPAHSLQLFLKKRKILI